MPLIRKRKPQKKTFKKKGKKSPAVSFGAKASSEIIGTTRNTGSRMMNPKVWNMIDGKLPDRVLIRSAIADMNLTRAPTAIRDKYTLAINNAYQFDNTGATALQPNLFDVMATLYKIYHVHSVKVNWNIRNTTNVPVMFGLLASDNALVSALSLDVLRVRAHKSIILNASGSNGDRATLSANVNIRKLVGQAYNDSEYNALVTGSPSNIVYLHLVSASTDESTNITYRIGYDAVLSMEYKVSNDERALD